MSSGHAGIGLIIYFDNAATSWPKPPPVQEAMMAYLQQVGGSPGRSGHRMSIEASRIVGDAREAVAELFGVDDPSRIAFTKNASEALNMALLGRLQAGDHVITSSLEHNSVMRPLRYLEQQSGLDLTVLPCCPVTGWLEPDAVRTAIRNNTRLIVMVHASNVVGNLLPIKALGAVAGEAGIPFLVDAAQTAGAYPIDVDECAIDMLAFAGHKSLLGPPGTGGLYVREGVELRPLLRGGTGSRSELEIQPDFLPDQLETGTLNGVGLAGLAASVRFLLECGVDKVCEHERQLVARFVDRCAELPAVTVYGPSDAHLRVGVVSFNVAGVSPSQVGLILDRAFGIMTRVGLHCAPAAHRTLGTYPDGTVRFGFGLFNTLEEVDIAVDALRRISEERGRHGRLLHQFLMAW